MKKLIILFVVLLFNSGINAQVYNGSGEVWFLILNHFEVNDKWTVGNELHLRRSDGLSEMKQFIARPFVNFKPGENVVYTAGYSFITTHPHGDFPLNRIKPEHNVWEQFSLFHSLDQTSISHRFRLEHRFQGDITETSPDQYEIDGYDFAHRFRYRFTLKQNINEDYFFNGFNELWISMDKRFKTGNLSQNWLYLGFGKNIPNGNVQLAYLRQHSIGGMIEKRNSLQLTFQYDF